MSKPTLPECARQVTLRGRAPLGVPVQTKPVGGAFIRPESCGFSFVSIAALAFAAAQPADVPAVTTQVFPDFPFVVQCVDLIVPQLMGAPRAVEATPKRSAVSTEEKIKTLKDLRA